MKRLFLIFIFLIITSLLLSCKVSYSEDKSDNQKESKITDSESEAEDNATMVYSYKQISQTDAKRLMETENDYIIVDVRERDEYDGGHIPNAILMPYESTTELAPSLLPDKNQLILIYCRSGRRSKIAAEALAGIGYTNVLEFGGIIDWQYEIVK